MRYFRMYKWQTLNKNCIITLLSGLAIGFTLAYVVFTHDISFSDPHSSHDMAYMQGPKVDPGFHSKNEDYHLMEDTTVADKLHEKVRILCWIMTSPSNHEKKAKHVKNTWGKRCNILLFMSTKDDPSLPAVSLPVKEGRKYLWEKTKGAFRYIYKNYLNQADWFVKADDDTYMILENLRFMLMSKSPDESVYYGCKFKPFVKQGYMSGGAGYVLSREAVRRLIEVGFTNATGCAKDKDTGSEDVEVGKCMEASHVKAGDSRDYLGRGRFFPFVPEHHLIPGHVKSDFWYWHYIYYDAKEGMECCSDNAVSFHYVSPNQMYVLEYLIYHLRPYGISNRVEMPPALTDSGKEENKKNTTEKKDRKRRSASNVGIGNDSNVGNGNDINVGDNNGVTNRVEIPLALIDSRNNKKSTTGESDRKRRNVDDGNDINVGNANDVNVADGNDINVGDNDINKKNPAKFHRDAPQNEYKNAPFVNGEENKQARIKNKIIKNKFKQEIFRPKRKQGEKRKS